MLVYRKTVPGLAIYSYLIGDESRGAAIVIDPTRDVEKMLEIAAQHNLEILHILETHVHSDFFSGAKELRYRLNDRPIIHSSGMGGTEWTPTYADEIVREGDQIFAGRLRFDAVHTPGHSPEHVSWLMFDETRSKAVPSILFTGDFLLVDDVGRPDLLGEESQKALAHQQYRTLLEKLETIPDFTEIMPTHGAGEIYGNASSSRPSSTLGFERRFNKFLSPMPEDEWVSQLMKDMPPAPPYFARMKIANREGPPILGKELPGLQSVNSDQIREHRETGQIILDTRTKQSFAAAHIPGSINIPFGDQISSWAGWVIPYNRDIMLIVDYKQQPQEVITQFIRVGFDRVCGFLRGGINDWEASGLSLSRLPMLNVQDLESRRILSGSNMTILDVRTQTEWESGHIENAVNIHAGTLIHRLEELPRHKPIYVVCGSGFRSSIAASILERAEIPEVAVVTGGMTAWKAAGLPIVL